MTTLALPANYLATFQQTVATLMTHQATDTPETLADHLRQSSPSLPTVVHHQLTHQPLDRLQQYAWMVYANVSDTLEGLLPHTHSLLGEHWEPCVKAYLLTPVPGYTLFAVAEAFPDFLAQWRPAQTQHPPWQVDVARFEVAQARTLRHPAQGKPVPHETTPPVTVNPTAEVLTAGISLPDVLDALAAGDAPDTLAPLPHPTSVLVYRDASHEARTLTLSPLVQDLLALTALEPPGTLSNFLDRAQAVLAGWSVPWSADTQTQCTACFHDLVARQVLVRATP